MMIADLHIHSKYSRATSRDCDASHLELWARYKGVGLVGTGDFTHPAWRKELEEMLAPAEDGLYVLKDAYRLAGETAECASLQFADPRFVISGEISTIYKKNGKTRKVHHVILLPSLQDAETLSHKLEAIGNLHSDGRPILGLDSRDLLEITLETCPQALYIPAHIWTPHFSLFGAFSGFDTLEECYGDLTPYVRAAETGLSSDPPMNRRVSLLDGLTLVSNSDAHSPGKLGREANLLNVPYSYARISNAIQTGDGFLGTLEFFPEEGKYHLDGHRACNQRLEPEETLRMDGICPVCGKKVTIGVLHRVEELADRPQNFSLPEAKPFESLIPLPEVIAASTASSVASKRTQALYFAMLQALGPELSILRELSIDAIEAAAGHAIAEGIRRLRSGKVQCVGGYDGEYGVVSLFGPDELERMSGQLSMLVAQTAQRRVHKASSPRPKGGTGQAGLANANIAASGQALHAPLNEDQEQAVTSQSAAIAVVSGPGTGKTRTLVERAVHLIQQQGVSPYEITAVTFTNQAAAEIRQRIQGRLKKQVRGLTVGTFHAICLQLLEAKSLIGEAEAESIVKELLARQDIDMPPRACLRMISDIKNGLSPQEPGPAPGIYEAYRDCLREMGARDLDDLLLDAIRLDVSKKKMFTHILVDEFQDMNPTQHRLIRHWARHGRTLFVIGDPDQSIYGFRGADAQCFAKFKQEWPAAQTILLRQNYRSAPAILSCAQSVINQNPGQPRLLVANRPAGLPVRLLKAQRPFDEAVWIATAIGDMVGGVDMQGARVVGEERHALRSFSDIGVLCRTRRQLERMETCLRHESIPCVIHGREDALSDSAVIGALGFFRFLMNPRDGVSLESCLRLQYHVPPSLIQRVQVWLEENTDATPEALREAFASLDSLHTLERWLADWEALGHRVRKDQPRKLLQSWVEAHGKNTPMEHLLTASVFHKDMPSFLQTLVLGEEADLRRFSGHYTADAVCLMTVHGSKGLEFPVVFLSAGAFPLAGSHTNVQKIEEERRLFFVGMTRARDELIVTTAEENSLFIQEFKGKAEIGVIQVRKPPQKLEQLCLF